MIRDKHNETNAQEGGAKVGVYICRCGGNISDHVDVERLAERIENLANVVVTRINTFMCSDLGQEMIQSDIRSGRINRVVVASCAPSLHELTFRGAIQRAGMNPYLYEHANIREQVSWVHHGDQATAKAAALVSAAVAKAGRLEPLSPVRVKAFNHTTIIGGGVAGMRAALDVSRRGIDVTLVEKTPYLGGYAAGLTRLYPAGEDARAVVGELAKAVLGDPRIQVLTSAQVTRCEGYVGHFELNVKVVPSADGAPEGDARSGHDLSAGARAGSGASPCQVAIQTGAVIMATGFRTYVPRQGEYGYSSMPEVMTLPEFLQETSRQTGGPMLTIRGRKIRRLAFIHCVGSRQIPGLDEPAPDGRLNEYCSRTCCSTVLRTAAEIRRNHPHTHVLDYYRDIRTYGRGQEEIYEDASGRNVLFFRYEPESPPEVERGTGEYPLQVRVKDTLTCGEELATGVDLVVLAVGMEASPIPELVEMMKLPVGADRFLQEVHPKLRPVELANNGILLAGTCQAPMDIGEACAAAQAAAAKAATLLGKGYVALDPYVAEVDTALCTGQSDCVQVCPVEGAIVMREGATEINPALCTGCGICVAECPEKAIRIKGWTLEQYEAMVDAIAAA